MPSFQSRLGVALIVTFILFIFLRSPSGETPQPKQVVSPKDVPKQGGAEIGKTAPYSSDNDPAEPVASLGEVTAGEEQDNRAESMSDKLFDYLKGHTSHDMAAAARPPTKPKVQSTIPSPSALPAPGNRLHADPVCTHLPDTSDLLVVVRTPASDLYNHLPQHLLTDLRCVDFLLFSTVHQNLGPHTVHDALKDYSKSRKSKHKDFELYEKLQTAQINVADLSEHKEDNDHNLDRWTIIPHILSTYKMNPDKKWYIFIESDTYLSVANLLPWIKKMDHKQPIYAGAPVMIGDVELAHSGSGILVSNAAAEKLFRVSATKLDKWEEMIGNSCCGDKILAEAFKESGIRLHKSFPIIQGETPFSLDWSDTHWCRPAVTWHRMSAQSMDMLWQLETLWVKQHAESAAVPPMLFKDYFQLFLVPLIRQTQNRTDWDNLASSLTYTDQSRAQYAHYSYDACRAACDLRSSCVQFAWEPNKCRLGTFVRWGEAVSSERRMISGWSVQRVEKFGSTVGNGKCSSKDIWILPGSESELLFDKQPIEEPAKDALQLEEAAIEAKLAQDQELQAIAAAAIKKEKDAVAAVEARIHAENHKGDKGAKTEESKKQEDASADGKKEEGSSDLQTPKVSSEETKKDGEDKGESNGESVDVQKKAASGSLREEKLKKLESPSPLKPFSVTQK